MNRAINAVWRAMTDLAEIIVDFTVNIILILSLISVGVCLVLFFLCFFTGNLDYAFFSLLGLLCFVYVNKRTTF